MALIANPIYDSVFKFLMEDNRVAKILLSALLKKEVIELEMRRNEYTNMQQTRISLYRIDFSAKLRDKSGKEQLVLIELQKTWLITETLRFRQYLGTQYLDKGNISDKCETKGFGLPIISIYILGHKVGVLQQPVVYVRRRYLDYDDQEIKAGVPDPFIESLTHDSIIVQIPYLKGHARNHLERLLTVFDQDSRTATDEHLLNVDEDILEGDERLLIKRLTLAAASPDVRRDMQVEDEILSEIEERDTAIMLQKEELERHKRELEQNKQELEQNKQELEQNKLVIEQQAQILRSTVRNLAVRGLSSQEIASILSIPESEVASLLN